MTDVQLIHGDCLEVMKGMEANSVHAIVTDPPYGLGKEPDAMKMLRDWIETGHHDVKGKGFMGKSWDAFVPQPQVWKECLRVLKPGGHILAFGGTRTFDLVVLGLRIAGFEIRDSLQYLYGVGFPKSTDISKQLDQRERKEWLDVSKAVDNMDKTAILEAWKENSETASNAELLFAKSETATGIYTPRSGFALDGVVLSLNQENADASAVLAELSFSEAHRISEVQPTARNNADEKPQSVLAKSAESQQASGQANNALIGIVRVSVRALPSGNTEANLKAVEALKTWLGRSKSSSKADTDALCAALTDDLKRITLSQSKTFQNFDTIRQTACVSAINATITESTAASLISFTVDTLRSKAIDKAAGAEREVVETFKTKDIRRNVKEDSFGGQPKFGTGAPTVYMEYERTAPATDAAKLWHGWGTALKPSHEDVILATKPLDLAGLSGILAQKIGAILCQLPSLANVAGADSTSSRSGPSAASVSAQWSAAEKCNSRDVLSALMAMWRSGSVTLSSLSIALSWLDTLAVICSQRSTFTTETVTSLTTDLRILNCLLSETTPDCIIRAATGQNGTGSNAERAASIFSGVASRLETILERSARGLATVPEATCSPVGGGVEALPICLAMKPLDGTFAENALKWGVAGLAIDRCRIDAGERPHIERRNDKTLDGDVYGSGINGSRSLGTFSQGRFPANIIHDGSEEVLAGFPVTTSGSGIKNPVGGAITWKKGSNWRDSGHYEGDTGSAARFFYTAKASQKERNCNGTVECSHPTVKPISLMRYLCRLVRPPQGGVILDPFMGSGSTGMAAIQEGCDFIGIELDEDYFNIAKKRIESVKLPLFT